MLEVGSGAGVKSRASTQRQHKSELSSRALSGGALHDDLLAHTNLDVQSESVDQSVSGCRVHGVARLTAATGSGP